MKKSITWVGMDDAASKIDVAVFVGDSEAVHDQFEVANNDAGLGRFAKRLKSLPGEVRCVYEAGVNGYHLQRFLASRGISCAVAAPSLTPRRAGNRVKTNPRDAISLARLYRSKELVEIAIPDEKQESLRDLMRAREDALEDQLRARHRLVRFLFRRGLKYEGGKAWTQAHVTWIKSIRIGNPEAEMVLNECRQRVEEETERLKRFDEKVLELTRAVQYERLAGFLMSLRGVKQLTAMTVIAETIDLKRFADARGFMASIGLVPSEYSTGTKERRGSITKTGNAHLRRVLIESAWHYRHGATASKTLTQRRIGIPQEVLDIARKADKRLSKKFWHLVNRGKDRRLAAVAVSRELAGFIWAIGQAA